MRRRGVWRLRATIPGMLALLVLAGCADSGSGRASAGSGAAALPTLPTTPTSTPASPIAPAGPVVAQTKVFVPVSTSVGRTTHGTCWTSSITVHAANAYRCFAGHDILDPCFASSRTARAVVCYADPWSPGVRVLLAVALPQPAPLAVTHPWAIELANGKRCIAVTGVVDRIGRLALLYQCRSGGAAGLPSARAGGTDVEYVAPGTRRPAAVAVTVTWQA